MFFFQSLTLAIKAAPYLFFSKLFFEMKMYWFMILIPFTLVSVVLVEPLLAIVMLPISFAAIQTAITLGTFHSMLAYLGYPKEFQSSDLTLEVIKMCIVRSIGFFIAYGALSAILYSSFSIDEFFLFLKNSHQFREVEMTRWESGNLPTSFVVIFLFLSFTMLVEAILAVPMAAAAYGISPTTRSFNGFWGLGFYWHKILTAWILLCVLMALLWFIVFEFFSTNPSWTAVIHYALAAITDTEPDLARYPFDSEFTSKGAGVATILLTIVTCLLPVPFWAATGTIAFERRLNIEHDNKTQQIT